MKRLMAAVIAAAMASSVLSCASPKIEETQGFINSIHAAAATLTWQEIAPGVWKGVVGKPEEYDLLKAAGAQPLESGLNEMGGRAFPLDKNAIAGRVTNGRTVLRFPLALGEDIYGLGVDFKGMRRTGMSFQLHEDHWSGTPGRTHAPDPFYVSSKGYGVFINTARYVKVNVGLGVRVDATTKPPVQDRNTDKTWAANPRSDAVEAMLDAPGTEVYVFAGPTAMDAVRRFNLLCGGGALPPKWGLGFLTRTPSLYTADEAAAEVAEFRRQGIPLDMLGLEPGWQSCAYPGSFDWDKTRFPDPAAFVKKVGDQHVHVNLWFNPYVSPTAPLYEQLLPWSGSHLVWNGIVPDYSTPQARKIFGDHLNREEVGIGVSGFKIDEVDGGDQWLWPDWASFPSGHDGEQMRSTYGLTLQRTVFDLYHQRNERTMGQVRGTNAGASRFPFVIYNDNYDFNEYITAVGNSAFAGVLWSPEVRGGDGEDMLRRTQAVCFSPLALFNGWATKTKLWTHAEVKKEIRDAIVLRERLLPYWYTAFAEYHYQGTPVIRPMPLIPGATTVLAKDGGKLDATANPYAIAKVLEVKDQYMVGDALLVAPIAAGVKSRTIILPPGKWFDFYTGKLVGEGGGANEKITVTPPLDQIPLLVKDGSLVPMVAEREYAPTKDEVVDLEVRHYGDAPGRMKLYDDDGVTFNFEHGDCSWTTLSATRDISGGWAGTVTQAPNAHRWHYGKVSWKFMGQ